jgi:membrane protein YdbS with pleckstrin-like domain
MSPESVLAEATFNRKVRKYWLFTGTILCVVTVVGILFLPIWLLFGHLILERHLRHMSCTLTDRSLKVTRGIWVRQEKTVPLDKITDLALVEGPLMRHYDLQAISVETAGQSGPGALIRLVGIDGARAFRDRVLKQRDVVMALGQAAPVELAAPDSIPGDPVLVEIRDALLRIEDRLPRG